MNTGNTKRSPGTNKWMILREGLGDHRWLREVSFQRVNESNAALIAFQERQGSLRSVDISAAATRARHIQVCPCQTGPNQVRIAQIDCFFAGPDNSRTPSPTVAATNRIDVHIFNSEFCAQPPAPPQIYMVMYVSIAAIT